MSHLSPYKLVTDTKLPADVIQHINSFHCLKSLLNEQRKKLNKLRYRSREMNLRDTIINIEERSSINHLELQLYYHEMDRRRLLFSKYDDTKINKYFSKIKTTRKFNKRKVAKLYFLSRKEQLECIFVHYVTTKCTYLNFPFQGTKLYTFDDSRENDWLGFAN